MELSIGKIRGLQQCTSDQGTLTCLALDHRQNLRKANPAFIDDAELSRFKLDVSSKLADLATAVLLDPEVSAAQAVAAGALPGRIGLVVAVEATGYGGTPTSRESRLLPGWSVEKAKRMGASMVKLLVYYHPNSPSAPEIETFVQAVAADCQRHDLGLMLEPLSYSLEADKKLTSAEKLFVVCETARRLVIPGVEVLKAEFPLDIREHPGEADWSEACAQITTASRAPWILLSAAVDFETYLCQVEIACRAGACGCAAGRAVWQEAVNLDATARLDFLRTTGRARLEALAMACRAWGRSIREYYTSSAPFDWYKEY